MSKHMLDKVEKNRHPHPLWARRSSIGRAWYSSHGDRQKAIRHILHIDLHTTGDQDPKKAEDSLDRFLARCPEIRNYTFKN